MSKSRIKVITIVVLIALVLIGLASAVVIPSSEKVKDKVAEIGALNIATGAYVLAGVDALTNEVELKEADIQGKLKELSLDYAKNGHTVIYDKIGNITLTLADGSVAYSCANMNGYGLGKCDVAILSKKMSL